jgi:hypothetical protein
MFNAGGSDVIGSKRRLQPEQAISLVTALASIYTLSFL